MEKQQKQRISGFFPVLVLPLFILAGCSEDKAPDVVATDQAAPQQRVVSEPASPVPPAPSPQVILDSFGVGKDVYVRALAVDKAENSIWIGTSVGVHQVNLADNTPIKTFTREHGLANEYVFAINVDQQGNKWFGTNAGGISRYKDDEWKTYFPMHGLADYWVYSFANQSDGTLWIGTWAGANRVDAKTGEFTTYVKELINEWVYGLAVDSQDRVWFGTEGGITMYDGKTWRSWSHADGLGGGNSQQLPASKNTGLGTRSRHDLGVLNDGMETYNPNYVFSIAIAPGDVIWAGTWGGGVSVFDGQTWKNYGRADGLAGNIVYSVLRDSEGVFWFGTNGGLSRFDGKSWRNYGPREGLNAFNIYALAEAPNGDIWAGTRGAVYRLGRK
jgi:ligand-binding sensor domain-containing protein